MTIQVIGETHSVHVTTGIFSVFHLMNNDNVYHSAGALKLVEDVASLYRSVTPPYF